MKEIYNKFKCTADKCKQTCCEGWDINIDEKTYSKWNEDKLESYLSNTLCKNNDEYIIRKDIKESCPFLDEKGLCKIVKVHGDDYISETCRTFPRIINDKDIKEYSLSCACPEVVELIYEMNKKLGFNKESKLLELKLRNLAIEIIQNEKLPVDTKILIAYDMLLTALENNDNSDEIILELLEKYSCKSYIDDLYRAISEDEIDLYDSLDEINSLFLDIIANYKEVPSFKKKLEDIYDFAQGVSIDELYSNWNEYNDDFKQNDLLIENIIVSEIYSNCSCDSIEELVISFQLVILEYILIKYANFISVKLSKENEINLEKLKEFIVCFYRIIGNNKEAVIEFIYEGFESEVFGIEYANLILI